MIISIGLASSAEEGSKPKLISGVFETNEYGFIELCRAAHSPCGMLIDANHPFNVRGLPIEVSRMKISEAMDIFVKGSPAYRWRDDAGTILIEPKHLPDSMAGKLNSTPLNVRMTKILSSDACREILHRVGVHSNLLMSGPPPIYAEVSTNIENLGAVAALNKVAREDGQMMWVLSFRKGWFHTDYSFITATWRREQPKKNGGTP